MDQRNNKIRKNKYSTNIEETTVSSISKTVMWVQNMYYFVILSSDSMLVTDYCLFTGAPKTRLWLDQTAAMSDDEEKDIFEELIERKRYKIVKYINAQVFFDKLRQVKILSMDDTLEISSKPTRRQQAGLCSISCQCCKTCIYVVVCSLYLASAVKLVYTQWNVLYIWPVL